MYRNKLLFALIKKNRMSTPPTRLDEARKQIRLAKDELEDESLTDDLQDALALIENVQREL